MATPNELLAELGLSKTESAVYRAGLGGSASATELSRKTGIKRPTVYHALETLMMKGLAAKRGTGARLAFSMTPPASLKSLIERQIDRLQSRKEAVDRLAPLLSNASLPAPINVAHYEGQEGVQIVIDEALYCRSRRWDIIAPKNNFFAQSSSAYARAFLETRERRGIVARSLWEKGLPRHALTEKEMQMRNPRWLPDEVRGAFTSLIIIFDDKVAILSSKEARSAILIQSTEINATFKAVFEALWLHAKPYVLSKKRSVSK